MKKSTKTFSEARRELAIILHWRPLLEAARLFSEDYNLANVLMLSGAIIHDTVVRERADIKIQEWMHDWSERVQKHDPSAIPDLPDGTYEKVLREMSRGELAALQDRLRQKAM